MKIAKKGGAPKKDAPSSKLVPVKVKWKVSEGKFVSHGDGELTVRALAKALGSLNPKRGETSDVQYFVKGPHVHLENFKSTQAGGQTSYSATGRVLVGRVHMAADSHSEDVHSFSLKFKAVKDRNGLPEIEVEEGQIDPLPRGTTLSP